MASFEQSPLNITRRYSGDEPSLSPNDTSRKSSYTKDDVVVNLDMSYYGSGRGASPWSALGDVFRGKNWNSGIPNLPKNDDFIGLNFITRPEMRLDYDNIGTNRILTPLNTRDPITAQYAVKMYLDALGTFKHGWKSPLVDANYPFIPLLDNTIIESSGWPDIVLEEEKSNPGKYNEVWGRLKGVSNRYGDFPLNINHINPKGSPINLFYSMYLAYIEALNKDRLAPHDDYVGENRFDYQCRYYRFILGMNREDIVHFGCNGYMYPRTDPMGEVMNFATDKPTNAGYDTVSVQWSAFGAFYNDPRILLEFNRTVIWFNPLMADSSRKLNYRKVPASLVTHFNAVGYPYINLITNKFEVWVSPTVFNQKLKAAGINPNEVNLESGLDAADLAAALNSGGQ